MIELVPTLSHCVESAARDEYEKSLREYLRADRHDQSLQERIELLLAFLQSMDFPKLRRESEMHLIKGEDVRFIIYMEDGRPKYDLKVGKGN